MNANSNPVARNASGLLLSIAVYSLFAMAVYWWQGAEPPLNIDHIAYFKLANEIMLRNPDGHYWREISPVQSYGVLMAYLFQYTGSHIQTLKYLLAIVSVLQFLSFELFASLFEKNKLRRISLTLVSGFFVSFGASFWGLTDFSASLNRTLVMPLSILAIWFYLQEHYGQWRYLTYPVLVLGSIAHLSIYYVIAILLCYEFFDFFIVRKRKIDRRIFFFGLGLFLAILTYKGLNSSGVGQSEVAHITPAVASKSPNKPGIQAESPELDVKSAWIIERRAFPWRNMPLPLSTVAVIALSYGVIFLLAVAGAWGRFSNSPSYLDWAMLWLALSILLTAYGLQTLMWVLRSFVAIYPLTIEETRAINFIMLPSLYFIHALGCELSLNCGKQWARQFSFCGVVSLVLIQPLLIVRLLPESVKIAMVNEAVDKGFIDKNDSVRLLFAQQLLNIGKSSWPLFYYSIEPTLAWLNARVEKDEIVMTDRNEGLLLRANVVGPFVGVVERGPRSKAIKQWESDSIEVSRAYNSRNKNQIVRLAEHLGASYVILPWPDPKAVFSANGFSVLQLRS